MSTDYTNVWKDKFFEPFRELLRAEYNTVEIYMDPEFKDRGSSWINIFPVSEETEMMRSLGQIRNYEVVMHYFKHGKVKTGRKFYNEITEIGERIRRLIGDNSNFTIKATWVSQTGTWGSTSSTWSNTKDNYCWHGMKTTVDYNPDVLDEEQLAGLPNLAIIEFTITFTIEEVYE